MPRKQIQTSSRSSDTGTWDGTGRISDAFHGRQGAGNVAAAQEQKRLH